MRALLYDHFWIYIVFTAVLFGASIYLTPKLIKFLDRLIDEKKARKRKKAEAEKAAEKRRRRRWRRRNEISEVNKLRDASNEGS